MAAPQVNYNSMQRVKVYCWNHDSKWDDRGTGRVSMDYLERSEELGLYVIDEEDNATLLVHRISIEDIYRKEKDTISWRDTERSTLLALSFTETAGCCYVWDQISNMRRNLNFNSMGSENMDNELMELPDVDLSTLPQILKIVTESDIINQMRLKELMLEDKNFFLSLMNVFDICETSGSVNDLHIMFNIVRRIISLNSPQILEKILGDKLFMKIMGCLEYNPDVHQRQHHRKYLKEHVVFKEAIPIKNPLVLSKIHQIYRIGFLKDVVLTRELDDETYANLNSILAANKATVLTLLKDDSTFFKELFARLRSPSTSAESRNNLVDFLHEFCSLSKSTLDKTQQLRFIRELVNDGIFESIAEVLKSPDKKLVLTGADILFIFLTQDPSPLRFYVVQPQSPLLGLLVKGMMEDFGDAMECQFIEIFRILLDSNALSVSAQGVNLMDIFCEKHLPELVDFITASFPEKTSESASGRVGSHCGTKPNVLLNICELLRFCGQHDSYKTKFLHKNGIEKVLLLTQRKEKSIVAAVIRVFRTLLSVLDDNVHSYIVKNNLMKPIIDVFVANSKRDNLLRSAVLELLDHIRKKNATALLKYVVNTFWDQLAPFEHLTCIDAFKTKYEQCLESEEPKEGPLDKEKDNRVEQSSDEEKPPSASNTQREEAKAYNSNVEATISVFQSLPSGGLVDYDSDKDDEDCNKPPPEKRPEGSEEETEDLLGLKNKSPSRENEEAQSKGQRLCSTNEGNKNSPGQGGEATEPENTRSSDNSKSSDEEKVDEDKRQEDERKRKGEDRSALEPSES